MIATLQEIDTQIMLFLNGLNHRLVDPFMADFSGKWIWVPLYLSMAAVLVWRFGWKRGLIIIALCGVAVGASDFVGASIIRPLVQRMRPANLDNPISVLVHTVNGYRGGSYGFPSCHAANTFALATYMSLILRSRRFGVAIFCWAALQCYSRIYLGVHYPGDIIAGAAIGIALGYAMQCVAARFAVAKDSGTTTLPILITGAVTICAIVIEIIATHL